MRESGRHRFISVQCFKEVMLNAALKNRHLMNAALDEFEITSAHSRWQFNLDLFLSGDY